jgi:hypothetical protein
MKRYLIAVGLLLMGGARTRLVAQTPRPLREELVGTWRLVAARQRLADGTVRADPQTGPRGVGYIMYDATGHVCVVLANPDRPAWKSPQAATDGEVRSAFEGLVAYCGTYETDESRHAVIHHVEADREPHVMGTDRTRLALVTGTRLVLRPVVLPPGVAEWTVEWERVGARTSTPRAP